MKRFLLKSVACIFLASLVIGFFHIENTYAATTPLPTPPSWYTVGMDVSNLTPTQREELTAYHEAVQGTSAVTCGITSGEAFGQCFKDIGNTLLSGLMGLIAKIINYTLFIIISLFSFILAGCGKVLDAVIGFNMNIGTDAYKPILDSIKQTWIILRDIFNIFFIFILLYISIATILQITNIKTKEVLKSVIIAAVLINFSMFFTKIVIDTSNIFTVALYNQIVPANSDFSISTKLMDSLDLQSFASLPESNNSSDISSSALNQAGLSAGSLGLIILQTVQLVLIALTIWAFLQAIILLTVRLIAFFILLALSPIGFMGGVLPKINKYSDEWKETLINQCLVAPVFLFFILLLTKVVGSGGLTANLSSSITQWSKGSTGVGIFAGILNVVIIMGFMITAVKVTKNFSGKAGATVMGWGASALGLVAGIATGGAAFAGRASLGRVAAAVAGSDKLKGAASTGGLGGFAARMTLKAANSTSKATFDARNVEVKGVGVSSLIKKTGVDIGKGGKGGFVDKRDDYAKAQTKNVKDNLNRDDLTEDQALEEYNKAHSAEIDVKHMDSVRYDITQAKLEYDNPNTTKERKSVLQTELDKKGKEFDKLEKLKKKTDLANEKDQYGNLLKSKEALKARKDIHEEMKKSYQEKEAVRMENSFGNRIISKAKETKIGGKINSVFNLESMSKNKAAADKIRKDVIKGKDDKEKLADLVTKINKDNTEGKEKEGGEKKEKEEGEKPEEKPKEEKKA